MDNPASKVATYEDLIDLPENVVGEIIHGRLQTHRCPAPRDARAASILGMSIGTPFDRGINGPGGWWIVDEPELHLADGNILVPDIAGWRVETMPVWPETAWFETTPDWVCEVLFPSTALIDRTDKMPIYAAHGVGCLWLVDPALQTLEAYRLVDGHWSLITTAKQEDKVRLPPFDAIELSLAELWEVDRRPQKDG